MLKHAKEVCIPDQGKYCRLIRGGSQLCGVHAYRCTCIAIAHYNGTSIYLFLDGFWLRFIVGILNYVLDHFLKKCFQESQKCRPINSRYKRRQCRSGKWRIVLLKRLFVEVGICGPQYFCIRRACGNTQLKPIKRCSIASTRVPVERVSISPVPAGNTSGDHVRPVAITAVGRTV